MYRQSFWMAHYFHPNFKLTKVWSTARSIWKLDFGPLDQKTKANATTTTKKYINAKGEARFTGTQALKASQYPGINKYWFQVFFFLPSSIQNLRCFSRWLVVPIPQGLSGSFLCTYREAPKKAARQFTFNVGCCALGFGNGLELVGEETWPSTTVTKITTDKRTGKGVVVVVVVVFGDCSKVDPWGPCEPWSPTTPAPGNYERGFWWVGKWGVAASVLGICNAIQVHVDSTWISSSV